MERDQAQKEPYRKNVRCFRNQIDENNFEESIHAIIVLQTRYYLPSDEKTLKTKISVILVLA